jgi:putative addiction module killer protein
MSRRVIVYEASNGCEPFNDYVESLRDRLAAGKIKSRVRRAQLGNLGDYCGVGEGVIELRIHYGPGYRVYLGIIGDDLVVLCAGDKSTQNKDIDQAKTYWTDYKKL